MTGIILIKHLIPNWLWGLFMALPIYYLKSQHKGQVLFISTKTILLSWSLFFLLVFIFQWPVTYMTQDIIALRGLFILNLFALIPMSLTLIRILEYLSIRKVRSYFQILGVVVLALICIFVFDSFQSNRKYLSAFDRRNQRLTESQGKDCVDALPVSRYVPTSRIQDKWDSNLHLKNGLGLAHLPCEN